MSSAIATQVTRSTRLTETIREESAFGEVFSDHVLSAEYRNGEWTAPELVPFGPLPLSPAASALHYGQSVFEGFKAHRTVDGGLALFRPSDNLARLNRSAARLAMPPVPAALFLDGVSALVRLDRDWAPTRDGGALYVRPLYFATDEALVVRSSKSYRLVVMTSPGGPYFSEPVRLIAEEHFVRAFPGGTGDVKPSGNYAGALLAAQRAQTSGFHNVLWLDALEHRFVEESGLMNIVFVIGGAAVTPALTGTILPGITRDSVLTLLRDMNVRVEERPIPIDEIVAAHDEGTLTEAFGVGTAATIAPISKIRYRDHDLSFTTDPQHTVGARVRSLLEAIRTGRAEDRHGWLLRV
jgi:branched-chain amino acid aminotransferase